MIKVKRFEFNTTRANCYVVSDETKECVIIDPCAEETYEREKFIQYIHDEGLKPVRCLLTHGHYDHLLSCDQVRDEFGLLPEVHHRDKLWMDRIEMRIEEVFGEGGFKYGIVKPEHYLQDYEVITFGSHYLITLHTPGHSPGSVVFYCEKEYIAFTGDTLFRQSIGRSNLLFGHDEALMSSLEYITSKLPNDCIIYPGHDLESTIGFEKENNPYLKKHLVVLTGAGISAESGLSTFRGKDGMWNNKEWEYLASHEALYNDTQRSLDFYNYRRKRLSEVEPNHAHGVLAELEKEYRVSIITQNVDDLHERAGSTNVLHLHGEMRKVTGSKNPNDPKCITEKPLEEPIFVGEKAADGSQLRPFIVTFGENVPNITQAERIIDTADIFVIIGTSLTVYPANMLINPYLKIPRYIIDPSDIDRSNFSEFDPIFHVISEFDHIKTTAVEGIDILKEKLKAL